jgi:hypothetical protein
MIIRRWEWRLYLRIVRQTDRHDEIYSRFSRCESFLKSVLLDMGTLGGTVGWGTALQAGRSLVLFRLVSFS